MNTLAETINAFVEDTCVIVVLAVLLARGRMLLVLERDNRPLRESIWFGLLFGAVGFTEVLFPGARFPYVTHTMVVTFTGLAAGLPVGLLAAAFVSICTALLQPGAAAALTACSVVAAALTGSSARRILPDRSLLIGGLAAGVLAQVFTLILSALSPPQAHPNLSLAHLAVSLPANGVGVLLLALVVRDAQVRAASERHRMEAERAQSLATQAQLSRLRARMHPHFLFNTLSSVAGLCGVAPDKAEAAIVRLGSLMRRVLETDTELTVPLRTEIDYARDYMEIEQDRLGDRLSVDWLIDSDADSTHVPPFSLQTLIENAVGHGVAPKVGRGHVQVRVRQTARGIVVAVSDDGEGMDQVALNRARCSSVDRLHGLQILDQQLRILYGNPSRLRLFSRPYVGTLAAFAIPDGRRQRWETHSRQSSRTTNPSPART